jgi:hypothetical protein
MPARLLRAFLVALVVLGLLPGAAFAQTAPQPKDLLVPASVVGDGWTPTPPKADGAKAKSTYTKKGTGQNPPTIEIEVELKPTAAEVEADFQMVKAMITAFGGQLTGAPQFGDKGLKLTMSLGSSYMVGYLYAVGTAEVSVGATFPTIAEADAAIGKIAQAEYDLVKGAMGSAPTAAPTSAKAKPAAAVDPKTLVVGVEDFGKGWTVADTKTNVNPQLGPDVDVFFAPVKDSNLILGVEVYVVVANDPSQVDAIMQGMLTVFRNDGWATVPSKVYGDRPGVEGTLGKVDVAGYLEVFAVGNRVAGVMVKCKPEAADDAYDLADEIATAQEDKLYN